LRIVGAFLKADLIAFDNEDIARVRRSTLTVIVAVLVAATACSESNVSTEVALEAHWQCDVQRLTFDDLAARDAELGNRITTAGMTADEYAAFKEQMNASTDLRLAVAEEYEQYCVQ
jgi:hypothetical protein